MISLAITSLITFTSLIHFIRQVDCVGCKFPLEIRGEWSRSRDGVMLTFSDSQLTGLGISWNSQKMNQFDCHMESAGNYIINSSFVSLLGTLDFYVCWKFVKVTPAAYILYELSNSMNISGFDATTLGHVQSPDTALEIDAVCTKKTYFTTLVKKGAQTSEVSSTCPAQLNATFTYSACPNTLLDFCQDGRTGVIDYNLCSTLIFQSASGVVTCMGHVLVGQDIYINLFTAGKVTCFKIPDKVDRTFTVAYYNGDCSTVMSGGSTPLTLTQKSLCLASTTVSTAASRQATTASETTANSSQPGENAVTKVVESKGDDSVGIAAGLSVGLFALVLLALLLFVLVWRQKLKIKVSDFFQTHETKSAPEYECGNDGNYTTKADAKEEDCNNKSCVNNISTGVVVESAGKARSLGLENVGVDSTGTDLQNINTISVAETGLYGGAETEAIRNISGENNKPHEVQAEDKRVAGLNGFNVIPGSKSGSKRQPAKKKVSKNKQSKQKKLGKIKLPTKVQSKK